MQSSTFSSRLIFTLFAFVISFGNLQAQKAAPAFSFTDTSGESFTHNELVEGLPLVVIFFDPYCDHCEQQAQWIAEAEESFRDVQILWVTTEEADPVIEFREKHFGGVSLPHNRFLLDTEFMFDGYFGYSEVPSIYLYNKEGKRTKSFTKETPTETLLRFL